VTPLREGRTTRRDPQIVGTNPRRVDSIVEGNDLTRGGGGLLEKGGSGRARAAAAQAARPAPPAPARISMSEIKKAPERWIAEAVYPCPEMVQHLGFLYSGYDPRYYYGPHHRNWRLLGGVLESV